MHLPYWREQLEEVEGEVRRLIRGYANPLERGYAVIHSQRQWDGTYCTLIIGLRTALRTLSWLRTTSLLLSAKGRHPTL